MNRLGDDKPDSSMSRSFRSAVAVIPPPPSVPPPGAVRRSVSEEDDDDDDESASSRTTAQDPHAALVEMVQQDSTEYRGEAMAYLLRYETMVRQQEAEDMAVLAHIRPCVSRLLQLLGMPIAEDLTFLTQEISFSQLKRAVTLLEQQQESSRLTEFMTTDRQLLMVLRLLTQKVLSSSETALTWAEFVQCYKVCIAGMLTLQHLPKDSAARARARDRTLAMLSLFEPPSTQLFHEDAVNSTAQTVNAPQPKQKVVDSAPLTEASPRGEATRVVPLQPTILKQRRWLKKRTKRALLFTSMLLLVLYPVMIYISVQFATSSLPAEFAASSKKQQRGALEPILKPETVAEPFKPAAASFPKTVVNGAFVKPKKRRRPLLGLWLKFLDGPVKGVLSKMHKDRH